MLNIQKFTVNPFQENTYVLYNDEQKGVLIDPGFSNIVEQNKFKDFIQKQAITLEAIWLTHAHIDHILGLEFSYQLLNVPIFMHSLEQENLTSGSRVAQMYGLPYIPFTSAVSNHLDQVNTLHIGKEQIEVLFTPGHSAGSVSFYNKEVNAIISGDVLFLESIGRTDLPGGNPQTLEKTVLEKMYHLPTETIVYSGHGPETSIGYEKDHNPFFRA